MLQQSVCRKNFLETVLKVLEGIAPLKLADNTWDNVGVIADTPLPLNENLILVTNDLTEQVVHEALQLRASMIISYHPPWFKASKNLSLSGPLRNLSFCIANGITVFSPHTALDAIVGGVNDWMTEAFKENISGNQPIMKSSLLGYENCGFGRLISLKESVSFNHTVSLVKKFLGLKNVRAAKAVGLEDLSEARISSIAVCAGSGGSVFAGVKADLFITGEMGHHQVLELSTKNKASVILTEHTNCERGYLRDVYCPLVESRLKDEGLQAQVVFSCCDSDPIIIV